MTAVYILDRAGQTLTEELVSLLPPWRRERLDRLRAPAARQESLSAGLLLAYAMKAAGVPLSAPVTLLPAGKPVFAGRNELWFSLSHSGDFAMCAMGPRPVGADVQTLRPTRLSVARRLHPAERRWIEEAPEEDRTRRLFRVWTRKEAWVKAVSAERMLSLSEADVMSPLPGLCFRDEEIGKDRAFAAVCAAEADIGRTRILTCAELIDALQ